MRRMFNYSQDMPETLLREDEFKVNDDPLGFIEESIKVATDLVKYAGNRVLSLLDISHKN